MPTTPENQDVPEDEKDLTIKEEVIKFKGPLLAIPGMWIVFGLAPYLFYDTNDGRGTFGDMFGAVNSLFSGLAFGGVICAILLQRKELQLQRRELRLTRREMEKSSNAQTISAKALSLQFELNKLSAQLAAFATVLAAKQQAAANYTGLYLTHVGNQKSRLEPSMLRAESEAKVYDERVAGIIKEIDRLNLELEAITYPTTPAPSPPDTGSPNATSD
ncbi:hypothetical protein GCM10023213_33750 [Prosthecobacter algae]|uniref:Uncharacterized protein n=1 Tax=Prosthecobacter algae TaxID=1144682 RepID=A0ABP9PBX5_9BACT